jgi:hypothetical protein
MGAVEPKTKKPRQMLRLEKFGADKAKPYSKQQIMYCQTII